MTSFCNRSSQPLLTIIKKVCLRQLYTGFTFQAKIKGYIHLLYTVYKYFAVKNWFFFLKKSNHILKHVLYKLKPCPCPGTITRMWNNCCYQVFNVYDCVNANTPTCFAYYKGKMRSPLKLAASKTDFVCCV